MTTWKAPETTLPLRGVGIHTNVSADESPARADVLAQTSNHVFRDISEVWLACRDAIRSRLAEHVLESLGGEEGGRERKC